MTLGTSGDNIISLRNLSSLYIVMHNPTNETLSPSSEAFNLLGGTSIEHLIRRVLLEIIMPEETLSPSDESLVSLRNLSSLNVIMHSQMMRH